MGERTFNRNKASKCLEGVEAGYVHPEAFLDLLEKECVLPDPRIVRIEALLDSVEWAQQGEPMVFARRIRTILAGGDV